MISINGVWVAFEADKKLNEFLLKHGYQLEVCAIAINGEFVSKDEYQTINLQREDQIDVVQPMSGG